MESANSLAAFSLPEGLVGARQFVVDAAVVIGGHGDFELFFGFVIVAQLGVGSAEVAMNVRIGGIGG